MRNRGLGRSYSLMPKGRGQTFLSLAPRKPTENADFVQMRLSKALKVLDIKPREMGSRTGF